MMVLVFNRVVERGAGFSMMGPIGTLTGHSFSPLTARLALGLPVTKEINITGAGYWTLFVD